MTFAVLVTPKVSNIDNLKRKNASMDIYLPLLIPFKTCSCCGVSKEISLFHKHRAKKDGLQNDCRDCQKAYDKARYHANPEKEKARRKAYYHANPEKEKASVKAWREANPEKVKAYDKAYYQANPDKVKAQRKAHYQANPEKEKARSKAYREANPEKEKARRKAYRETYKDEPWFKVMESQTARIPKALKGIKRAAPAQELVGGWNEMAAHLESQFLPGMTWQNHGNDTWHIDHIKPCASFDFNDPQQQHECFHWSNTQPLWAADNISKG